MSWWEALAALVYLSVGVWLQPKFLTVTMSHQKDDSERAWYIGWSIVKLPVWPVSLLALRGHKAVDKLLDDAELDKRVRKEIAASKVRAEEDRKAQLKQFELDMATADKKAQDDAEKRRLELEEKRVELRQLELVAQAEQRKEREAERRFQEDEAERKELARQERNRRARERRASVK